MVFYAIKSWISFTCIFEYKNISPSNLLAKKMISVGSAADDTASVACLHNHI